MGDQQDGDISLEVLEARVATSMAYVNEVVEGWMKASDPKYSSSSRISEDVDIEELMRLPPRLGVGASAAESSGVRSRETAKLQKKLAGKKRGRDEELSNVGGVSAIVISEDDDEDSRTRMIVKKARLDPFEGKGKKAKTKKNAAPPTTPAAKSKDSEDDTTEVTDVFVHDDPVSKELPSHTTAAKSPSEFNTPSLATTKRKKKKKHKTHVGEGAQLVAGNLDKANLLPKRREVIVLAETPPPEPSHTLKTTELQSPLEGASSERPALPLASHDIAAQSSPQRLDPFGQPLLNLSGPPATEGPGSPKKKRKKRKKKKKRGIAEATTPAEIIDVDAEDGDEGEDD